MDAVILHLAGAEFARYKERSF